MTSSQGSDHEETGSETRIAAAETELLGDLDQAAGGALSGQTLGLVDLGKHGVGGLRDDGGGETGEETGTQVVEGLHAGGSLVLVDNAVDGLVDLLEDTELGHGVGNLLEQDGPKARVEGTNTLVLENLAKTADKAIGEGGLRNETDTGGLERAKGDVSEELSHGSGSEVDSSAVVGGRLVAEQVDGLLLEQLVSSKLEGALEEVAGSRGTETGPDSASTLVGNDLPEATDQARVVREGVELYPGLDAIEWISLAVLASLSQLPRIARNIAASHWRPRQRLYDGKNIHIDGCESAMSDGAADGTRESESRVQVNASRGSRVNLGRHCSLRGVELGRAGGGGRRRGGHFAATCGGSDEGVSGEVWWRWQNRNDSESVD